MSRVVDADATANSRRGRRRDWTPEQAGRARASFYRHLRPGHSALDNFIEVQRALSGPVDGDFMPASGRQPSQPRAARERPMEAAAAAGPPEGRTSSQIRRERRARAAAKAARGVSGSAAVHPRAPPPASAPAAAPVAAREEEAQAAAPTTAAANVCDGMPQSPAIANPEGCAARVAAREAVAELMQRRAALEPAPSLPGEDMRAAGKRGAERSSSSGGAPRQAAGAGQPGAKARRGGASRKAHRTRSDGAQLSQADLEGARALEAGFAAAAAAERSADPWR